MRFEKWQALGNDYLVFEAESFAAPAVRRLCDPHFGPGSDGVLALSAPTQPGFVARLRIYNPDGSEAELSGNGARIAILYLRRHWTQQDTFSIETAAGEIRPTITGPDTCRVDMGRARLLDTGELPGGHRYQSLTVGNPQCAIRVADAATLEALDLSALGPPIEADPRFPNRTNVSFWTELAPDRISARIFERGVGETLSSGTGASGAAIAHVVRGGDSPVRVALDGGELEVDVTEDLHVDLTGWARPVYTGELSPELASELA